MFRNRLWRSAACLLVLLALIPAARVDAQTRRCFPETGQCLEGRFRTYWEQNGGLAVFGYPTTPARNEINRETGASYLTQWFERNRFEYHPENAAPYDVLLGRLGDDRLVQQGVDWRTLPREDGPRAGCLWFAQTGHNVCDQGTNAGFRTFWSGQGLQDPGLNQYNRSLALFGLPLTAARTETNGSGDTVMTQWFERARLEWHPGNAPSYRVLLGLLGHEVSSGPDISIKTYTHPSGLWTVEYPSTLLHPEDLGNGVTVFISADRSTFAAVDTYIGAGNEYGNTGEDLRNRARDTLDRIYGTFVENMDGFLSPGGRWETGIAFTTTRGSKGEAVYGQRGRDNGDRRVFGFLFGYKATSETDLLPQLATMRMSFRAGQNNGRDVDRARESLTAYFSLLNAGSYSEAIKYFGGSYEFLQTANPSMAPNDHVGLMRWACGGLVKCLPVRRVVSESTAANEFTFIIEFSNRDGTQFKLGPCCGGTGEPMTEFRYTVKKIGSRFLVQELPQYVP